MPSVQKLELTSLWKKAATVVGGAVVLMQLVPYGRDHQNPPVRKEPAWDTASTRALAVRACFDCHSNESEWPWYSWVAPVSWLVQHDVNEGREHLNFSEWDRPQKDADEAVEEVEKGEMPMFFYLPTHPEARFNAAEKDEFLRGLRATLSASKPPEAPERDEDD